MNNLCCRSQSLRAVGTFFATAVPSATVPHTACFLTTTTIMTQVYSATIIVASLGQTIGILRIGSLDLLPASFPDESSAHGLYCLRPFWPQLCLFFLTSTKGTSTTIVRNIQILCHLDSTYLSIFHAQRPNLCTWCHDALRELARGSRLPPIYLLLRSHSFVLCDRRPGSLVYFARHDSSFG